MTVISRLAAAARSVLLALCLGLPMMVGGLSPAAGQGAGQAADPLPSWTEGPTKAALLDFVKAVTEPGRPTFVDPADRIATFDQDGTLWVEKPVYSEVSFAASRLRAMAETNPALKDEEPFKTAISGDEEAMGRMPFEDLKKIILLALRGVSVDQYRMEVVQWLETARNPRLGRLRRELVYQPMREVLDYLRGNGFRTYIVTGGGQDFVRAYSQRLYGVPPEQVVGTADAVKFGYDAAGRPVLTLEPSLLLEDIFGGKPEGIHLVIGKRPLIAFGNSTGDRQMLEYAKAGAGARLSLLVLHDDARREVAYGPALGLPASEVGTFTQALHDEAKARGWFVISMKSDWKRVFSFEPMP
ncbi:HAD family hydrolase [Xanthobacter autotrophicus DSM 431]|uniref:HAD family hydrolase n=1 Tax=Xanthobacter nonsaccharivorans TaxID=3119912 RepID=UPI0037275B3B